MGVERYFSLKTERGPKEQVGLVVKSDLEGRLEDLTGMLTLKKVKTRGHNNYYDADANVNINGKSIGEKEIIGLKVDCKANVTIYKQPLIVMIIEEIDNAQAQKIVSRVNNIRYEQSRPGFIVVSPRNAPIYGGMFP